MPPLSGPFHTLVLREDHHPLNPSVALTSSVALGVCPLRAHGPVLSGWPSSGRALFIPRQR